MNKKDYANLDMLDKADPTYMEKVRELVEKATSPGPVPKEEDMLSLQSFLLDKGIKSGLTPIKANWIYHLYAAYIPNEIRLPYISFFKVFSKRFKYKHSKTGRLYLLDKEPFQHYFTLNKEEQNSIGKNYFYEERSTKPKKQQETSELGQSSQTESEEI